MAETRPKRQKKAEPKPKQPRREVPRPVDLAVLTDRQPLNKANLSFLKDLCWVRQLLKYTGPHIISCRNNFVLGWWSDKQVNVQNSPRYPPAHLLTTSFADDVSHRQHARALAQATCISDPKSSAVVGFLVQYVEAREQQRVALLALHRKMVQYRCPRDIRTLVSAFASQHLYPSVPLPYVRFLLSGADYHLYSFPELDPNKHWLLDKPAK